MNTMDRYTTGAVIRRLREDLKLTQAELAETIHVSDKTISKWETGQGFPDIVMLEPLARALRTSVTGLLSGEDVRNRNRSFDMERGSLYVCPVCGNVIRATGEAAISCCGITLLPLDPEPADPEHPLRVEIVEDEYYATVDHPMRKDHYISFLAAVSDHGMQFVKLYPEGGAEARFRIDRVHAVCAYCSRHGLFRLDLP